MVILVAVVVVVVVLCCGAGCALSGGPGQAGESIESIAPRRGAPELSHFSFSITNLDDFSPAFSALVVFSPAKSYGKVSRSQTATETSSRQLVLNPNCLPKDLQKKNIRSRRSSAKVGSNEKTPPTPKTLNPKPPLKTFNP